MTQVYRVFGSEMSPFSVKVRSWFRYKGVAHQWVVRNAATDAEYQKHARLPIVPLVVTPGGEAWQDSTPMIEKLEALHPDPAIHPADPVSAFVSVLLEEFGDEWGNKWMFHYRWAREVDQLCSAGRLARAGLPEASEEEFAERAEQIRHRMVDRVWFVGSNAVTAPLIEQSFTTAIAQLDAHLEHRPYLFGGRPALADFGLWGQLYCAWTDPTAGALIEARAGNLLAWIQRMLWPGFEKGFEKGFEGGFEDWHDLEPTLMPFLVDQVGRRFMPWTLANARAIAGGLDEFQVELQGETWIQKPQKYHARSLQVLRDRYRDYAGREQVEPVLSRAECLSGLVNP